MCTAAKSSLTILMTCFREKQCWGNIWRENVIQNITNNSPSNILKNYRKFSNYCHISINALNLLAIRVGPRGEGQWAVSGNTLDCSAIRVGPRENGGYTTYTPPSFQRVRHIPYICHRVQYCGEQGNSILKKKGWRRIFTHK